MTMMAKRATVVTGLLVLSGAGALFVSDQRLKAHRGEREANFVTIHFAVALAADEEGEGMRDLESVLKLYGAGTELMKPFPDGLVYKANGESFTLEEPRARSVSLLKRDRLVATEKKWPRWERSGEYARKFPGQEVPGKGYE